MSGGVIKVGRRKKLGLLEWLYLPMIARALFVSGRHFVRNLRGFVTGKNRRDFVVQYPEERVVYPAAFRGMPVLVALENGRPRCVACGLCEYACPTRCISIQPAELHDAAIERYPERFDIDMSRCMFCGLCEEACPEEAIVMSPLVEIASYDRDGLLFEKEALLVPPELVQSRLDYLRRSYEREVEVEATPDIALDRAESARAPLAAAGKGGARPAEGPA